MRILIVEDDSALSDALGHLLAEHGCQTDAVATVFQGIEAALTDAYDCLIVDIGLADGSGLELVRELRALDCTTPILILTVSNEAADRVEGLNSGADDYMGKPFDSDELIARLNALVRRNTVQQQADELHIGSICLNRKSRTLQSQSGVLELSSKEFMLLEYLVRHHGQILSRPQLESHLWGPDAQVAPNALDTYVYFLRKKCSKMGMGLFIKTIRGEGYTLDASGAEGE